MSGCSSSNTDRISISRPSISTGYPVTRLTISSIADSICSWETPDAPGLTPAGAAAAGATAPESETR
ncbi:MAG: hypothetical protein B5M56_06655 [Desulfococcus sp. 4484_241]|nr:MAG: hypothetical protein B5M56_06655 [Desulfococcus sp. 4484_241]